MAEKLSFYTPGNIMLTGEYVVLNGARALAVPLKLGQQMDVFSVYDSGEVIKWVSEDANGEFFKGKFSLKDFSVLEANDQVSADFVASVLKGAKALNPHFLEGTVGCRVTCKIEFSRNHGFGSSATLICNIAKWARVDALELNAAISKGAGCDVAVGMMAAPILFQVIDGKPESFKVSLNFPFTDKMWLVYLGHKVSTSGSVLSFNPDKQLLTTSVKEVSKITDDILDKKTIKGFKKEMKKHDKCISALVGKPRVKKEFFDDFDGQVKSLGTRGGDFVLAVSEQDANEVKAYFNDKGFQVILSFDNLVVKNEISEY